MAFIAPIVASMASAMGASAATAATIESVASTVGTIASTAVSVLGTVQDIRAKQAQANANAKAARMNARAVEQLNAAETTIDRLRAQEAIGAQRAALARTGMDLGTGSPDFLTKSTKENLQYESNLRESSRINEALGFLYEASRYRAQAKQLGSSIPMTILGGGIMAGASIGKLGSKLGWFNTTPALSTGANMGQTINPWMSRAIWE